MNIHDEQRTIESQYSFQDSMRSMRWSLLADDFIAPRKPQSANAGKKQPASDRREERQTQKEKA